MSMGVKELLNLGERQLSERGVDNPSGDSKSLYCYMVDVPGSRLVLEYQNQVSDELCEKYFNLIDRRASGEPLQYIIGSQEFMGLKIAVDRRVLIPRLDTEVMVEDAVKLIEDGSLRGEVIGRSMKNPDILDLCCGSGAIGIALQKLCNGSKVVCSDVSEDAISLAKENAEANGVGSRIKFLCGDMFEPLKGKFRSSKFDMIICNPPYIKSKEINTLQAEVRDWEPHSALDGGEDGLEFYRIIAEDVRNYIKKGGVLLMEIGYDQGEAVKELLEEQEAFRVVKCLKDLAGLDRIIFAR